MFESINPRARARARIKKFLNTEDTEKHRDTQR